MGSTTALLPPRHKRPEPQTSGVRRILFLTCPTGSYCREDRCQSFFDPSLIPTVRQPLEECEAGGAIIEQGGEFRVIDCSVVPHSEDLLLERVLEYQPNLIVLAVTFGSLEADLQWARTLRAHFPNTPIGLRGAPCYVWPEQLLLDNPAVDFTLRGDYELIFSEIVTRGLAAAPGVTMRGVDGALLAYPPPYATSLDELPLPSRSGIDLQHYRVRGIGRAQATIRVQRGCPFPCTYCLVHTVNGSRARHRSAESIVKEVAALLAQGVTYFYFRADTFSLDRAWTIELCRALRANCPGAKWVTTTRVECVDEEVIASMSAAGCYGLSFGVDVASEEVGRQVRKKPRPLEAAKAMRLCDAYGIISLAYIMVGFAWDTRATLQEARDFIEKIRPDLITVHFAFPYPGTEYYRQVQELGIKTISSKAQAVPAFALAQLSQGELQTFARRLLWRHWCRPRVMLSLARKLLRVACTR